MPPRTHAWTLEIVFLSSALSASSSCTYAAAANTASTSPQSLGAKLRENPLLLSPPTRQSSEAASERRTSNGLDHRRRLTSSGEFGSSSARMRRSARSTSFGSKDWPRGADPSGASCR